MFFTPSDMGYTVRWERKVQKDNKSGQEKAILFGDITDEDAYFLISKVFLEMRYFPLSRTVPGDDTAGWVYYIDSNYSDPDDFKNYFLQFMNEETFNYLFQMDNYAIYDGYVARNTESELSRYVFDREGTREFHTVTRTESKYHIKVPFIYSGMRDAEPKEDYCDVWLEKQNGGTWKITKLSQWLNDLIYYEFKEYEDIFIIVSESEYEQFLKKYGENHNGERISTHIIRNGDYILPDSNKRLLTESDLQPLNKISAMLAYYEIEARHGYVSDWQDSFISFDMYFTYHCPWYEGMPCDQNELNDFERENQEILQRYIKTI